MQSRGLDPLVRATDANVNAYPSARLYFYRAGTLVAQPVYSSRTLVTSLGVYVEADTAGRFAPFFFDPDLNYDAVLKDSTGATIDTITDIFRTADALSDDGAGEGPVVYNKRISATPNAGDLLGAYRFRGYDSAGSVTDFAGIAAEIIDKTDGSEDGALLLQAIVAGALSSRFKVAQGLYANGGNITDPGALKAAFKALNLVGTDAALDVYVRTGSAETGNPRVVLRNDTRYDYLEHTSTGTRVYIDVTGTPREFLFRSSGVLEVPLGLNVAGVLAIDAHGAPYFPPYTAANIAAIGHAVNTANKRAGKPVWDTTNNRVMVASGASANSAWYVADASANVVPV